MSNDLSYRDQFIQAAKFNQENGLGSTELKVNENVHYLDNPQFFRELSRCIRIDHPDELVAQCNLVSQYVLEKIKSQIGICAYLTIGDVFIRGRSCFCLQNRRFCELMAAGKRCLQPQLYDHHAWITLDSMEILDFTMMTSLAMFCPNIPEAQRAEMIGEVIYGNADEAREGFHYQPMMIGEDFYLQYDAAYPVLKAVYVSLMDEKAALSDLKLVDR